MICFFLLISQLIYVSGDAAAAALLSVRQESPVIKAEPGGNVTMTCYSQGNFTVLAVAEVRWRNNFTIVSQYRVNVSGIQEFPFHLNLTSVRRNQSGTYVCEVKVLIPTLSPLLHGNGTVLIVTDSAVGDSRKDIFPVALWTALAFSALTVGIAFLVCYKYKGIKPASSSGENDSQPQAAEVLYATLNVTLTSPRPDGRQEQNMGMEKKTESPRSPRNEEPSDVVYSAVHRSSSK